MLYDNAQILELLSVALGPDRRSRFRKRSRIDGRLATAVKCWWRSAALRRASTPDSEGVEGKYYCWTADEILQVLSEDEADLFAKHYDVQPSGNWQEAHTGMRTNVLNRLHDNDLSEEIESASCPFEAETSASERARPFPPQRDDKLLTDWNGLMIAALANASYAFDRSDWLELARTAFRFVIDSMASHEGGFLRLAHSYRDRKYVRLAWRATTPT